MYIRLTSPGGHEPPLARTFLSISNVSILIIYFSISGPFILVHGFTKPIKRLSAQKYKFNVDRFGIFSVYNNGTDLFESHEVSDSIYCIEHVVDIKKSRVNNYTIFIKKSKTPPIPTNILITRWLKIVSCIFLVLTISVYLYLPKMRNLFGKILLSYCVSTLAFFTLLVLSQFYSSSFSNATCISIGKYGKKIMKGNM